MADAAKKERAYQKQYQHEWYKRNKEKRKKQIFDRRRRLAKEFREYKATLQCETCGESHPWTLDFHHQDPKQKTITPAHMVRDGWSWKRIMKELSSCQVLCANCHRKLHSGD